MDYLSLLLPLSVTPPLDLGRKLFSVTYCLEIPKKLRLGPSNVTDINFSWTPSLQSCCPVSGHTKFMRGAVQGAHGVHCGRWQYGCPSGRSAGARRGVVRALFGGSTGADRGAVQAPIGV